jgi:hypothetical protein
LERNDFFGLYPGFPTGGNGPEAFVAKPLTAFSMYEN